MRRIVMGVLGIALVAVAVVVYMGRDDDKYVVYAKFNDAGGILKNFNVKIGSIAAGTITDIKLDKQDNAVVKMELDDGAFPIGAGATAKVRPVNLLGEKYVDLDPGDLKQEQPSGTMIGLEKTGVPIELDDALNTLDPDTRAGMRILINEAGLAMAGRGADFNKTLTDLPPALDAAKQVVGEVNADNARLRTLIDSGDRVLGAVNSKADDLGDLIGSAGNALETAAQRRQQLGATVQGAPGALTQLRSTLGSLQLTSQQLMPTADDLVKTAPSLRQTLDRLPAFADDADSTLSRVRSVSPQLEKLGRRSTPTLRTLRPTMQRLASFATSIQPFVDTLDGRGGTDALLQFINGWRGVTSQQDNLGHVFRLRLTLDEKSLLTALERVSSSGPAPTRSKRGDTKPAKEKAPTGSPAEATPGSGTATEAKPQSPARKPDVEVAPGVKVPDPQQLVQDATNAVGGLLTGKQSTSPPPTSSSDGADAGKLLNYLLGS